MADGEEVGAWGGTGYVRREPDPVVVRWWQALPEGTRAELAALRPGRSCRGGRRALHEIGVVSPEVVVTEDGRRSAEGSPRGTSSRRSCWRD